MVIQSLMYREGFVMYSHDDGQDHKPMHILDMSHTYKRVEGPYLQKLHSQWEHAKLQLELSLFANPEKDETVSSILKKTKKENQDNKSPKCHEEHQAQIDELR